MFLIKVARLPGGKRIVISFMVFCSFIKVIFNFLSPVHVHINTKFVESNRSNRVFTPLSLFSRFLQRHLQEYGNDERRENHMVLRETSATWLYTLRPQHHGDQQYNDTGKQNVRGNGALRRVDEQLRENFDLVDESYRDERQPEGASRHNVVGRYKNCHQIVWWR